MIQLRDVTTGSGNFRLCGIDLSVPAGQYAVLMGPTGQGKTTLLETICGLRRVSAGRVIVGGIDVTDRLPGDRQIGYVPQDLALFPTMTVRQHIEFPLRLRRWPRRTIAERVDVVAGRIGLTGLLDRGVRGLSGGESQRVALARAMSFQPRTLLLDEPLSSLDDATRDDLIDVLRSLKATRGVTVLHVTHRGDEAMRLADHGWSIDKGSVHEDLGMMRVQPSEGNRRP